MDFFRNFFQNIYDMIAPPIYNPQPMPVTSLTPADTAETVVNRHFERERIEYERTYNIHERLPEMIIMDMVIHNFRERNKNIRNKNLETNFIINNLPIFSLDKKDVEEENPVCSICLETLKVENTVLELPCRHYFCFGKSEDTCPGIIPWLKTNMSCPVCRDVITINDFEI